MTDNEDIKESVKIAASIDWSNKFFNGPPNQWLTCWHCSNDYRGHGKGVSLGVNFGIISKEPCPKCGGHHVKAARSDPERWTINGSGN